MAVQEIFRDLVMLGIGVFHFRNAVIREEVDSGLWVGQQDRRVGGNDQLGLVIDQAVNQGKHAQLPLWRKR